MPRPTLLLIHGFPQDHRLWAPQVQALADVADIIAPDLRGFGDGKGVPTVMSMDDYASDLKALLDERKVERVVLCGLSMGGYVALAFLARWPERVQALILCNTRSNADTEEGRQARLETARNAFDKGVPVIARGMVPKVLSGKTQRERPELVASVEAMMAQQSPDAVAAASRGMAERVDRTPMLGSIDVPVLIITGAHDELMPLATSTAMHAAIPHSRLVVLPGAAHLSNMEAPELFNQAVRDLLQELTQGTLA